MASAGKFSGTIALTTALAAKINVTASVTVSVEINNTPLEVHDTVGATPLDLPVGPYLRVTFKHASITIGSVNLSADVSFERRTSVATVGGVAQPPRTVTIIAFANASIANTESTGGTNPGLKNASGAFVFYTDGVAGQLNGQVSDGAQLASA